MPIPISIQQILARYAGGERDFTALDLDGQTYDFSGATLRDADFSRCFLVASFRDADLRNAMFLHCNVKTCDFGGANLTGASFEGAAIDAATFVGADLTGSRFLGATEQGHVYSEDEKPLG